MTEIVPAILTNDINDFRKKFADLLALGEYFTKLHIDFIDGEFLPDATLLPKDLKFLKSPFALYAHFMTYQPAQYFQETKDLGFAGVILQYEAFSDADEAIEAVNEAKAMGFETGIAINPETPLYKAASLIQIVNLVQVMGVHPGAQGRKFEPDALEKIKELKSLAPNVIISVDGGMKPDIAARCAKAGARRIVVGSALMHSKHPKEVLEEFKKDLT